MDKETLILHGRHMNFLLSVSNKECMMQHSKPIPREMRDNIDYKFVFNSQPLSPDEIKNLLEEKSKT